MGIIKTTIRGRESHRTSGAAAAFPSPTGLEGAVAALLLLLPVKLFTLI